MTKSGGIGKVYSAKLTRASGPTAWNTTILIDTADPFIEMDLSVTVGDEAETAIWPSNIRFGERKLVFGFTDARTNPDEEVDIVLICTLYY